MGLFLAGALSRGAAAGSAPDFALASSCNAISLYVGGKSVSCPISLTSQSGFSGAVALTISGLPSGVSEQLAKSSITTKTATTVSFVPASTAKVGPYQVVVTASSNGQSSSIVLNLTVANPSFELVPSTDGLTLKAQQDGTIDFVVTDPVGLSGTVQLVASGTPAGVTSGQDPITSTTTALVFKVAANALPGVYPITVRATCGAASASAAVTLTIVAPSFALSLSPNSLSYVVGSSTINTKITVSAANGFGANVTLSVAELPSGMSASFSPSYTASASVLTLSTVGPVSPGNYSLTISGVAGNLTSSSVLSVAATPSPVTSITIAQPEYGFNVLPGSVRRLFATVYGGATHAIKWSTSGGATLSSTNGNWVDVTAPSAGSNCSIEGTSNPVVTSATEFAVTAQSLENPAKTFTIKINVCDPSVQVNVVPFYTTLYAGQKADVQAFVWGSVNRNVWWAITSQPAGGNGVLSDTENQDTVFSATVAGRYTLTATSDADGSKQNTATIYVTGHKMPYAVTPEGTMPVDCSVDPQLQGQIYDVGPSQPYKTVSSVPWAKLQPGSTVRIHNEDTTETSPTTYHEYFQVATHAERTQPVRVCGVPDAEGNLPVIDASSAVGKPVQAFAHEYAAVEVGTAGWAGHYSGTWTNAQNVIVEGLKIENAKQTYTYTTPGGVSGAPWPAAAACVRLFASEDTVVRGIDADNCGNGIFSDFNANNGFAAVANTLYEGNHVHQNGELGSSQEHQLYIQGWNEVVQFNLIDQHASDAGGSNFKGRGFPEIIRYNHFGDGARRQLDLVDNQDAPEYTTFEGYLNWTNHVAAGADYTADLLAAAVEAHHADYVYGNTFANTTAMSLVHYDSDMATPDNNRLGTLWFYNNSVYEPENQINSDWQLFDTSGGGGGDSPQIEWPQIQAINNAIWMGAPGQPIFFWNVEVNQFTTFGTNVINSNWGTGNMAGGNRTGWSNSASKYAFQGASNQADTNGVANLIGADSAIFDLSTFQPNTVLDGAGQEMPDSAPHLPVRFEFGPSAQPIARLHPLTVGAME